MQLTVITWRDAYDGEDGWIDDEQMGLVVIASVVPLAGFTTKTIGS